MRHSARMATTLSAAVMLLAAMVLLGVTVMPRESAPNARGHRAASDRRPTLRTAIAVTLIVAFAIAYWTDGARDIIWIGLRGFAAIRP